MYDSLSGPILFYLDIIYWYAHAFKDVRMYSKFVLTNSTVIAFFALSCFGRKKSGLRGFADIQNLRARLVLLNHVRPESFVVKQSGTLHHCNFYSTHFFIEHVFFLTMRKFIYESLRSADSPGNMRYFYHYRIFSEVRITGERPAGRSISCDLTGTSVRKRNKERAMKTREKSFGSSAGSGYRFYALRIICIAIERIKERFSEFSPELFSIDF